MPGEESAEVADFLATDHLSHDEPPVVESGQIVRRMIPGPGTGTAARTARGSVRRGVIPMLRYCSPGTVLDQVVDTGVSVRSLLGHRQVTTGAAD